MSYHVGVEIETNEGRKTIYDTTLLVDKTEYERIIVEKKLQEKTINSIVDTIIQMHRDIDVKSIRLFIRHDDKEQINLDNTMLINKLMMLIQK